MIHLVIRQPVPYQLALCRELHKGYPGLFIAWFGEAPRQELPYMEAPDTNLQTHYLDREGYLAFARSLWSDIAPIIILGGWSTQMILPTLLLAAIRRLPVFVWVDHPHPKTRRRISEFLRGVYLQVLDRQVAGFLACGTPTIKHLAAMGLRNPNILCFPYWVDIPSHWARPQEVSDIESKPPLRVLGVGRHVPVKGFDTAIQALARANRNGSSRVAELVLVGDGPEREALESLSRRIGCSQSVTFKGWLSSADVYREIQSCDVVVVPSSFEPYGVVVLEAMAAGRMVLASEQVIGAQDRTDGSNAILFHPVGDSVCLARQIQWLASDRKVIAQGSSAARRVAEKWPLERAVSILDEVLLNTKQGRILGKHLKDRTPSHSPFANHCPNAT